MRKFAFPLVVIGMLCASCSKDTSQEEVALEHNEDLGLTAAEQELTDRSAEIQFRLLEQMTAEGRGSFIYSPLSLQYAVGAMSHVLGEEEGRKLLDSYYGPGHTREEINAYSARLTSGLPLLNAGNDYSRYHCVQALLSDGFSVQDAGKSGSVLKDAYRSVFVSKSDADAFNAWAVRRTDGCIEPVIEKDGWPESEQLSTCGSVYFDGGYGLLVNSAGACMERVYFHKMDGSQGNRELLEMLAYEHFHQVKFYRGKESDAITFPIRHTGFSITLIIPSQDGWLSAEQLSEVWNGLRTSGHFTGNMAVYIPKFKTASRIDLLPVMREIGLDVGVAWNSAEQTTRTFFSNFGIFRTSHDQYPNAFDDSEPYERVAAERSYYYFIHDHAYGVIIQAGVYTGE